MSAALVDTAVEWIERGRVPDAAVRAGIRRLCEARRARETGGDCEARLARERAFVAAMDAGPVAPVPEKANEQHYELPPEFFTRVLGHRLKYSACLFADPAGGLDAAEDAALAATCAHAGLADGQQILELGCGWGSLTLWMAARYPGSRITAVSNSAPQRAFIEARAAERGLDNVQVLTADMNAFAPPGGPYDRVVSVEMFEHMRNWRVLLARIATWLKPGGRLLVHVFCHRECPYEFVPEGSSDWMARHFFTGGIMPSDGLMLRFQDHLRAVDQWRWSGRHYEATANAWLANLDRHADALRPVLEATYGAQAERWLQRWRVFFMACAELFGLRGGEQWWVVHHLLERPADA
ncbi:MAG: cyclopropane-fatty-acyl-phospholipid synthase family protein [Halofilum sp. (in: g-proteobacteria)]|nr:cyclopropane-fatty-acyl-phospholipid synthase family protein [Halofilum sp. (in: g-proteobacteria)]